MPHTNDEYRQRFNDWIRLLMKQRLDYQEVMNQLPADNPNALAECIDELVAVGALSEQDTNHIVSLSISENHHYDKTNTVLNEVMRSGSGYTLGEKLAFFCVNGIQTDDARALPGEILSRWLRMNEIAKARSQGVEALGNALEEYTIDHKCIILESEYWPVFPELPDALDRLVEAKQPALAALKDETAEEHAISIRMKMMWDRDIPSISNITRKRLAGEPIESWMLYDKQAHLTLWPMAIRPLNELLDATCIARGNNVRMSVASALKQYPQESLYANHEQIRTLVNSFTGSIGQRETVFLQLFRNINRNTPESTEFFERVIPPDDPLVPSILMRENRNSFDALVSRDYLYQMIKIHREDESKTISALNPAMTVQPDIAAKNYANLKKISPRLKGMLHAIVERELEPGADEMAFNKAWLREVAGFIRETRLNDFLDNCILSQLKIAMAGKRTSPLVFMEDVVNSAKPFLKKSALDELHEIRDGFTLLDDITAINELAVHIAGFVETATEAKRLSAIDNRVNRMTHETIKRIERDADISRDDSLYAPGNTL